MHRVQVGVEGMAIGVETEFLEVCTRTRYKHECFGLRLLSEVRRDEYGVLVGTRGRYAPFTSRYIAIYTFWHVTVFSPVRQRRSLCLYGGRQWIPLSRFRPRQAPMEKAHVRAPAGSADVSTPSDMTR